MPGRRSVALTLLIIVLGRRTAKDSLSRSKMQFGNSRRRPEGTTRGMTRLPCLPWAGTPKREVRRRNLLPAQKISINGAPAKGQSKRGYAYMAVKKGPPLRPFRDFSSLTAITGVSSCESIFRPLTEQTTTRNKIPIFQKVGSKMQPAPSMEVVGPWNEMALRKVEEWDPAWAEACKKMSSNPWENG